MPNWCENELEIEGPKELVSEVKKSHLIKDGEDKLDFEDFVHYPDKFTDMDKIAQEQDKKRKEVIAKGMSHKDASEKYPYITDGFNQGGHGWKCDNWGTKWNATDVSISFEDEDNIHIDFNTAWSPPIPVIDAMAKKYPELTLTLRFFECGAAFNGYYRWEKGKRVEEKEGDYFGNRGG